MYCLIMYFVKVLCECISSMELSCIDYDPRNFKNHGLSLQRDVITLISNMSHFRVPIKDLKISKMGKNYQCNNVGENDS